MQGRFKFHASVTFLIIIARTDYRVSLPFLAICSKTYRNLRRSSRRVPPHMLLWVVLADSHPCIAWNQSEGKGFVTPSFSPSHCDMTLEKIDQEKYFWTQLSITLRSDLQSANILFDSWSPLYFRLLVFFSWLISVSRPNILHISAIYVESRFSWLFLLLLLQFFYCINTKIKSLTQF